MGAITPTNRTTAPFALRVLLLLILVKLVVHAFAITHYGYFRDELYYLASTEHLSWGYVEHPPLSVAVLAVVRASFGDSLIALRALPVLTGCVTLILVAAIARRLGGGFFAQGLAALAVLCAPVFLGEGRYYSMNAFDQLFWAIGILLFLRALDRNARRDWIALGLALGLGLLNKTSVLWLGGGMFVGLLLSSQRRTLGTVGPWLALAIALLVFSPFVLWQAHYDWPMLEFMRNATSIKMVDVQPVGFLMDQLMSLNLLSAPIWIAGLLYGLLGRAASRGRILAILYLAILVLLLAVGSARSSYLAPAYFGLFALGGVALERWSGGSGGRVLRVALVVLTFAGGAFTAPFALPLLPVERFVRYQAALGQTPRSEENNEMGALPQHFADMFGWENMVDLVAEAYARLTPEEQVRCRVFGQNYGETGAIDVLGRRRGLPRAISGHNSYGLWGPGDDDVEVLIIIGGNREDNAAFFEEIEIVGQTHSDWSMPYERGRDVSIGRHPRISIHDAWPRLRFFI